MGERGGKMEMVHAMVRRFYFPGIAFLVGVVLTFLLHSEVILNANHFFFNGQGDGAKNYFTYAYHAQHGRSALSFDGMNQPYGEHVVYTDGHPALSILLEKFLLWFPGLSGHLIGLLNIFLLLDLAVCVLLFSLLLRRFGAWPWFSIFAACGIALLSPQVFRLTGHYSLAYSSFFPLTWYLIIRLRAARKKWTWALLVFLILGVLYWTHPYLGLISSLFVLLYCGMQWLWYLVERNKRHWEELLLISAATMATFMFKFILAASDRHLGRPDEAGGITEYLSSWTSLLHPYSGAGLTSLNEMLPANTGHWEGSAYLGIGCLVFPALLLLSFCWAKTRRTSLLALTLNNAMALLAALVLLFMSFGWFMDLPLIKGSSLLQFRSLGRFSWPMYYVLSVIMALWVFEIIRWANSNKRVWLAVPLLILPGVQFAEGIAYRKHIQSKISIAQNVFHPEIQTQKWGAVGERLDISTYDVLLVLPFFHQGSGVVAVQVAEPIRNDAMAFSMYSGIPMMGSYLTRGSDSEALSILQLLGPAQAPQELINQLRAAPRILVMANVAVLDELQARIPAAGDLLLEQNGYGFYDLSVDALLQDPAPAVIEDFLDQYPDTASWSTGLLFDSAQTVFYDDHESQVHDIAIHGHGALVVPGKDYTVLLKVAASSLETSIPYRFSFWIDRGAGCEVNPMVVMERKLLDGTTVWDQITDTRNAFAVDGQLSMMELQFIPEPDASEYVFLVVDNGRSASNLLIDDILLRPADADVFRLMDSTEHRQLMYNGWYYDLPDSALLKRLPVSAADAE